MKTLERDISKELLGEALKMVGFLKDGDNIVNIELASRNKDFLDYTIIFNRL
jgi:hypothetical protein